MRVAWVLLIFVILFGITPSPAHRVGSQVPIPPPPTKGLDAPRASPPLIVVATLPPPVLVQTNILEGISVARWQRGIEGYGIQEIENNCRVQETPVWCVGRNADAQELDSTDFQRVERNAREHWTYSHDAEDSWRVFSRRVYDGAAWTGDCDDLALTTLDLLGRMGQPLNKMWLMLVKVDRSTMRADHIIGVAEDKNGMLWIVGDTGPFARPLDTMTYRALAWARMDHPRAWDTSAMVNEEGFIARMQNH